MRIPSLLLIVLVGLVPIAVFASLVIIPPNVKWQPPAIWQTGTPGITAISNDGTGLYATGGTLLMKYDLNGGRVWTKQLGDTNNVTISGISVGTDGIYVAGIGSFPGGSSSLSVFVEKHDMNGNVVWANKFGNISSAWGISASPSGLYVAGLAPDGGPPVLEPLIMRHYDLNGSVAWTRTLAKETAGAQGGSVLVYAYSDGFYLAGSNPWINDTTGTGAFVSRYDMNGNLLWNHPFDNPPIFKCACHPYGISGDSTGVYLGGRTNDVSLPGERPFSSGGSFLRKCDPNGNVIWTTGEVGSWISQISTNGLSVYSLENGLSRYDAADGNRVWIFPAGGTAVAAGKTGVYVGGTENNGLLVNYDESASLVLFGVNPPYSFALLVVPFTAIALTVILFKKGPWSRRAKHIPPIRYDPKQTRASMQSRSCLDF